VCLFDLKMSPFEQEKPRFQLEGRQSIDLQSKFEQALPQNQDGKRLDEDEWCPFEFE